MRFPLLPPALVVTFFAATSARAEVQLLPSKEGRFGAWLVASPRTTPAKLVRAVSKAKVAPTEREPDPAWELAYSKDGPISGKRAAAREIQKGSTWLSGVLRLSQPLKGAWLIGATGGVQLLIDGKPVLEESESIYREDEHIVPIDLAAGDHPILVKLRHERGAWAWGARLVDENLAPPQGASLILPGTTENQARALVMEMATVELDRGLFQGGYRPHLRVRYPQGAPRLPLPLKVVATAKGSAAPIFQALGAEVPTSALGVAELDLPLPELSEERISQSEAPIAIQVELGGKAKELTLSPKRRFVETIKKAARALALIENDAKTPFLGDRAVAAATLEHWLDRLVTYVDAGDDDVAEEIAAIDQYLADLEASRDPLRSHSGIRRFAYRSPLDGNLSPFGVYVPPSYEPGTTRKFALVVVLQGMNGKPLSMIQWFFGKDDPRRSSEWEDRHPVDVTPIDAFVVAPHAHGNAMFRELGEVDTMRVMDWVSRFFPIDDSRVTITGVSMGGTGAAWMALRFPDRFAASAPLCGYHDYFNRSDIRGKRLRPWERSLAERRSNTHWAENGRDLPLFVWHGLRDLPITHSTKLIDRYEELGYHIEREHPDTGHDVWRKAYADMRVYEWLAKKRRKADPSRIVFKTSSLRYADSHWVHVRGLADSLSFGEVRASFQGEKAIEATTKGITALELDRVPHKLTTTESLRVRIDGDNLDFAPAEPLKLHRHDGRWTKGQPEARPNSKRRGLSGPIRDIFHEPLVFVVGTGDKSQTRANYEVARHFARIRAGVDVAYPIIEDTQLDEVTAANHSLVLIGNSQSNGIVGRLEDRLPFRIRDGVIEAGNKRFSGPQAGVAFIHPNPEHPARYVLVIEGTTPLGTLRATSLPDLLPDWIVYDRSLEGSKGRLILGQAKPLAAGMFGEDWSLVIDK